MDYKKAIAEQKALKKAGHSPDYVFRELIVKYEPQTMDDVEGMGISFESIGEGLFREAFRIKGANLVIKVPKTDGDESWEDCYKHAMDEVKKVKSFRKGKKYRVLWRYLPKILYVNERSGLILMPYYRKLSISKREIVADMISNLFCDLGRDNGGDVHESNVALGEYDEPVVLDFGYA